MYLFVLPAAVAASIVQPPPIRVHWVREQPRAASQQVEMPRSKPLMSPPWLIHKRIRADQDCARHGWKRLEQPKRVFDAFLFNNELDMLEARLHELFEHVHVFLPVELGVTYQGNRKNSTFVACLRSSSCHRRFEPFADKLQYTLVEHMSACHPHQTWDCENSHRNFLGDAFRNAGGQDEDVVLVSDVDEFPNSATAWKLKHCGVPEALNVLASEHYIFSANCRVPEVWNIGPKAVSGQVLKQFGAQAVRGRRTRDNHHMDWPSITHGGFHMAWMMTPGEMVEKLRSFSHQEFNVHPFNTESWLRNNALNCTLHMGWLQRRARFVQADKLRYPRLPWYVLTNRVAMQRFFMHSRS